MRTIEMFRNLIPGRLCRYSMPRTRPILPFRRPLILEDGIALAGYQYHRAGGVWPFLAVGMELRLRRERLNPYDRNAISVWFMNDRLGYIPRDRSAALAPRMDEGDRISARIACLRESKNPKQRILIRVEQME